MTLIDRVKNIILTPKTEWPVIDREPGDAAYLFTRYVAILAAIPAICGFIGSSLVGFSVPGMGTVRMGVPAGLGSAVVSYLLTFVAIYVAALIADALAPTFVGQKNFASALKLIVYAYTPVALCGFLLLIPRIGILTILGLVYGIYLLWLGLPILMKSPQNRALLYTFAVVLCAVVIWLILGVILSSLFAFPRMM